MKNVVFITGRLGKDVELKQFENNQVANLSVAVDDSYKDRNDEWVDRCIWFDVELWGRAAKEASERLKQGSLASFTGKVKEKKWQDKDGNNRSKKIIDARSFHVIEPKPKKETIDSNSQPPW